MGRRTLGILAAGALAAVSALGPGIAGADHSWGGYHWARTSNPFTLKLGDNVSGVWDAHLATASADWSASAVLDTTVVAGTTTGRRCRPSAGRIEVCNAAYGYTGWLGIAQIWLSGPHIKQGTAKMNDTYFGQAPYNTAAWRQVVTCQEIGHDFGLGHQDEDSSTDATTSCMDYTNRPEGNEHPDAHDYEQLEIIYAHLDGTTTIAQGASGTGQAASEAGAGNGQADWGRAVRYDADGRPSLFERDLGEGERVLTFVIWAT